MTNLERDIEEDRLARLRLGDNAKVTNPWRKCRPEARPLSNMVSAATSKDSRHSIRVGRWYEKGN